MSNSQPAAHPARLVAKAVDGASWTAVEEVGTSTLHFITLLVLARFPVPG
jgi:hypothetical protein